MNINVIVFNSCSFTVKVQLAGGASVEVPAHSNSRAGQVAAATKDMSVKLTTTGWDLAFDVATGSEYYPRNQYNHYTPGKDGHSANVFQSMWRTNEESWWMYLNIGPGFSSKTWMSLLDIDEETTLADITIPGAHDAITWNATSNSKCQNTDIEMQLLQGIRWFDLRLAITGNDMQLFHAGEAQGLFLSTDVLPKVKSFLDTYPSETVVLCVNHETGIFASNDTNVPPGKTFDSLLHEIFMAGVTPNKLYDQRAIPKLQGLNSCVVLMRLDAGASFGIMAQGIADDATKKTPAPEGNFFYSVQNCYKFDTDYLAAKTRLVKAQLEAAANKSDGAAWYINFTSASRAPLTTPEEIAIASDQQGVNYQVYGYLCANQAPRHYGTIPMDFPETPSGLIKLLILQNKLKPFGSG